MEEETNLIIDHFSSNGKSVGYLDHPKTKKRLKLEVSGGLLQEELLVALGPIRRKKQKAYLRKIIKSSPLRVAARCSHVPFCGGCIWQQMEYKEQLKKKEEMLLSTFKPILDSQTPIIHPIIGCSSPWHYRNKMEYSFSQNRERERFLGLIIEGSRGKVFNLEECHLTSSWSIKALKAVRTFWEESNLLAYNMKDNTGHLRTLVIRESIQSKGKMVILTVSGNPQFALKASEIDQFVQCIKKTVSQEQQAHLSIFLRIQQLIKGSPTQFFEMHLYGKDHLTETLYVDIEGKKYPLHYKISPSSFFQPNTLQAEIVYSRAIQMLSNLSSSLVYDLYCGTATLSLALALVAKEVIGIEINPYAVFDAEHNQELNQIKNFTIKKGDAAKVLEEFSSKSPNILVLDPPRSGLDPHAIKIIFKLLPEKILYISCQPKTQAENIQAFIKVGYELREMQPVDQFPHTIHLENIALLQLRNKTCVS